MSPRRDGYTRLVRVLKVALPLGALGLLSTMFFFSGEVDPTQSIPFAELDVDALIREQRLSNPYFSGVTGDGAAIAIAAASARPDGPVVDVQTVEARLDTPGRRLTLTAAAGRIDPPGQVARLEGGTRIVTSDGFEMDTDALTSALDRTDLRSDGPLTADTPFGTLEAGGMVLTADAGGERLVFDSGVRIVYQPR
ncbi:MAG: LPS export ABC transporter periplasmic protein LptC [Shimia sp.]